MPRYLYDAFDANGKMTSGAIAAASRRDALSALMDRDLTPNRLDQQRESRTWLQSVNASSIESFFEMLSDLLGSGMPLAQAMDVLCRRTENARLKKVVQSVRDAVVDGQTLAASMSEHPDVFPPLTLSLIHAGEQGAFLERSLDELAKLTRREQELRGRVIAAVAYPSFLLVVGSIVMTGMMLFFVPRFEPLFSRMETSGELPWATNALLTSSEFFREQAALVAAAVAVVGLILLIMPEEVRKSMSEKVRTRAPLLGPLLVNLSVVRFTRLLGTMLGNGVPIIQALEIARHSFGIRRLADAVAASSQSLQAGDSLAGPLRQSGLFPVELIEMISVGEQSNRLEKVLLNIADKLEHRTQRKLDLLVKLIEPSMMVVMAVVIGFLIVALLLPVFNSAGRFD